MSGVNGEGGGLGEGGYSGSFYNGEAELNEAWNGMFVHYFRL